MNTWICTVIVGVGATLVMDGWGLARRRLLRGAASDYRMLGRWLGHMARGAFRHSSIAATPAVRGERWIGWTAHYLVGIAFAAVLVGAWGPAWIEQPTIGAAMIVGIATVAAPFLVMQPAMGSGVAASRTPRPNAARLQSLVTHAVFGVGLYAAGWVAHALC